MRKDSPTPFGGGRTSPKKPRNLGLVAAVLAEQRRELEKERAQCKAQRRRLGTHVSILWELVQQSKQQLSDDLRFQQDAERCLEQLRQQRDDVMCPTPDLQRQLAQELENHGDCGRSGASEAFAGQYHCRLQEVQHLDRQPASQEPADPQAANSLQEPPLEAQSITRGTPKPDRPFRHLESLSTGVRFSSPNDLLSTRASFLESLATAHSCSLDSTLSCSWASESEIGVSSTSAPILGTSSPHSPPLVPSTHRKPSDLQEESSENKPGQDYHELVRKSLELAKALQELICCYLQQRREVDEVVKWLEVKHAELIDLALGLPDRAGKLQETNLRAVSSPVPGEGLEGLDLGQVFAHQRAQDLSQQAGALQAKDLEIEALRRECHLLQAHIAADLGSSSLPGGGATCVQWCNINDLDRVQCECQREVLCLQRQLTLHQSKASGPRTEACNLSSPSETARHQVQALERELGAQRRECEELSAQAATAERRRSSAKRRQRHKCRLC